MLILQTMNQTPLHQDSFFGQIFDQTIEGLLVADAQGSIVDANEACLRMFGYESKSDLRGKRIDILIPTRLHHRHQGHFEMYTQSPSPRPIKKSPEIWGLRKDGNEFPLEISLSPVTIQGNKYTLAYLIDVSERYLLSRSIQEGEALLQAIIETAVDGIITIDRKGKVESMNPAAARLFGYEPEEVVGNNVSMLMPEPYHSEHDDYLKNYHRTGIGKIIGIGREVKGRRKDGRVFPFSLSISKVEFHDRQIYTGIIHDISAMKEAEEKLRQYARDLERSNRELEDFAYVSSHDLQEPLRKIQAFGDWLREREQEKFSEKGQDYLNRMLNAAERLQQLINDLLTYSRVSTQAQPFRPVDLNDVLAGVLSDLELMITRQEATIEYDDLPTIEAEATQIRQVFQNLLSNAMKFRQADRPPMITIRREEGMIDGEYPAVILHIQDNGIGFDPKYKEKIFSIFQRLDGRKYEGSGIGLAIVKRIVNRHKGLITVNSELGKGSTFSIALPYHQIYPSEQPEVKKYE